MVGRVHVCISLESCGDLGACAPERMCPTFPTSVFLLKNHYLLLYIACSQVSSCHPRPPCSWMLGAVVKSCVGEWKSNSGRRTHIGEWESYSGACSLQPGMSQQTSELSTYKNKITAWSYIKWKWIVGLSLIFAVLTPEYSTWHELRLVLFVFPFEL